MIDSDWALVKHFSKTENWGDPDKMLKELVLELDAYRDFVATPIFISCGTNKQHLEDSQHPAGRAIDIMFSEKKKEDLFGLYLAALRFGFRGVGIYPSWEYKGQVIGGMHLDWRETTGAKSLWMGVQGEDGKQAYVALDPENLKKYGLV